jgi:DNA-binding NarL/FixJ family response regulator
MLNEFEQIELVGHVQNAPGAIELIGRQKPDVIILDIQLGKWSGIDVLRKAKHDRPSMIVVMLTNHSTPRYRKMCLEAGANYFFDKSTEFHHLHTLLGELIERHRQTPSLDSANKNIPLSSN